MHLSNFHQRVNLDYVPVVPRLDNINWNGITNLATCQVVLFILFLAAVDCVKFRTWAMVQCETLIGDDIFEFMTSTSRETQKLARYFAEKRGTTPWFSGGTSLKWGKIFQRDFFIIYGHTNFRSSTRWLTLEKKNVLSESFVNTIDVWKLSKYLHISSYLGRMQCRIQIFTFP